MRTWISIILLSLLLIVPAYAEEYYIYVRLEDRSGVTKADDVGRSKRGDVIDIKPVTSATVPTVLEKAEWFIYRADLTEQEKEDLLEVWEASSGKKDEQDNYIYTKKAYRRNKVDLTTLGISAEKGLSNTKATNVDVVTKTEDDLARYEIKRYMYLASRPFKKLYKQISNYWVKPAYAFATTTCGDDATADREQICTINLTGEDYNTLALWEDAKDGDLVTAQQIRTAHVYDDDGDLTDAWFTIDGSTTSSTYYMQVTSPAGERHVGKRGTGAKVTQSGWAYKYIIYIYDDNARISWLMLERASGGAIGGIQLGNNTGILIHNMVIYNTENKSYHGIAFSDGSQATIRNSVISDCVNESIGVSLWGYNSAQGTIQNVTVANCEDGYISYGNEPQTLTNTIAQGSVGDDYSLGSVTCTSCLSEDATSPNTDLRNKIVEFVNEVGIDYHLSTGDIVAKDAGTDLSGTFTTDIDGETRSGTWDIGADEVVTAAPTEIPQIIINVTM